MEKGRSINEVVEKTLVLRTRGVRKFCGCVGCEEFFFFFFFPPIPAESIRIADSAPARALGIVPGLGATAATGPRSYSVSSSNMSWSKPIARNQIVGSAPEHSVEEQGRCGRSSDGWRLVSRAVAVCRCRGRSRAPPRHSQLFSTRNIWTTLPAAESGFAVTSSTRAFQFHLKIVFDSQTPASPIL